MQEFQDTSNVTPIGLLFIVGMGILTLRLQRRHALMPLLITTCYMPLGQMFVIGGLHFHLVRVVLLIGLCRILIRRETGSLRFTSLDKLFIWWAVVTLVVGTLTAFSLERFINRS